ncbi:MAG TPA: DUF1631 family protein, partial [Rhodocyclaceae bacterium]|nr:DUF1631 family protein [Rhodocyclaceae bacterium]
LGAGLDSRTLLLRRLERHLQSELPELYRAINEVLVEAGVLPELKRTYRRTVAPGTLSPAADGANILSTLQRLAQARQAGLAGGLPAGGPGMIAGGGIGGGVAGAIAGGGIAGGGIAGGVMTGGLGEGAGGGFPPATIAVSEAFLQSLQSFQAVPAAEPGVLTNVVRLARNSEVARQVPPLEAITIDIVATLFDLIFDDGKVPAAVKGLVSRLQIPVLKVAMLDRRFFADRSHPARRFLDSISGIAVRWGNTVNEGDPFYVKLSELVERIQETFDKDSDVFGSAIAELSAFVNEREAMEADTTSVVAEIAQRQEEDLKAQHERQAAARQAADDALAPLFAMAVPRPIEQFLRGQWRAVLQNAALAGGRGGEPFQAAERIAGELVWSVAPKNSPDDRKRLVTMLPKLLPALHQGLDRIGTPKEARQPLLDALVALHSAAIRADVQGQNAVPDLAEPTPPTAAAPVELQVTHSVENGISIEQVSLPETEEAAEASSQDKSFLRRVKHLVRGDWIDFVEDDGQSRRERLTWISPYRSIYIFSNHATKAAISITPEALAHRLQMGTALLVEREAPMFERALDGAIKALDKSPAGSAG